MSTETVWTIGKVLDWTRTFFERKGIESARLDAELLIGHALRLERIGLYLQHHQPLHSDELALIRQYVQRRGDQEPVHYILGQREFWSLELFVDKRVLIPRPDTERLVEVALEHLTDGPSTMLDLCCGSGAIALAIATERPNTQILATDVSADALAVAAKNREKHQLKNVEFLRSDLFENVREPVHLIVSNPPYIPTHELGSLMTDVRDFEPSIALDGGDDGLTFYRRIMANAPDYLRENGRLIFEIGHAQAADIETMASGYPELEWAGCFQDLAGRDRVVQFCKKRSDAP